MSVATQRAKRKDETLLTYDDYVLLPDDRNRYEILEGILNVTPAPIPKHQRVARNLLTRLDQHVRASDLGEILYAPIDVVLDPHNVVQPDLVFIAKERASIVKEKNIQGAPDLIVEVLCPATSETDRVEKFKIYAKHGVTHYWIVDPKERIIEAYKLMGKGYRLIEKAGANARFQPSVFPGLTLSLGEIWGER